MILAASTTSSGSSPLGFLFPLILVAGLGVLMVRSSRRRREQTALTQTALALGAHVMTTSGLYATVRALDDEAVQLEIAPGVVCRFARAAVARVVPEPGGALYRGPDPAASRAADELPPDVADVREGESRS